MSRAACAAVGAVALALAGCGDGQALPPRDLVDHTQWQPLAAEDDPFLGPSSEPCAETEWGLADDLVPDAGSADAVLEVHTEVCGHLTLTQPSLAVVSKGDDVRMNVWHNRIDKATLTTGTIAIAIDGEIVWEHAISNRTGGMAFSPVWSSPRKIRAGTPIWFHVENHGSNTYSMGRMVASAP